MIKLTFEDLKILDGRSIEHIKPKEEIIMKFQDLVNIIEDLEMDQGFDIKTNNNLTWGVRKLSIIDCNDIIYFAPYGGIPESFSTTLDSAETIAMKIVEILDDAEEDFNLSESKIILGVERF